MPRLLAACLALALTVLLAACGGDPADRPANEPTAPPAAEPVTEAVTETAVPAAEPSGKLADGVRTVTVTPKGDEMLFEQTSLTVTAGETVRLVFDNTATSPAMQHNVVIVTGADVINRVGQAALNASATAYVPDDEAVIAATPLAAPGETVEVTFTAPAEPGTYAYICTFPGHYMMMQGTLTVVAPANT